MKEQGSSVREWGVSFRSALCELLKTNKKMPRTIEEVKEFLLSKEAPNPLHTYEGLVRNDTGMLSLTY